MSKTENELRDYIKENIDNSLIQIYYSSDQKIKVMNDCLVDAAYIDSEIKLDYFVKNDEWIKGNVIMDNMNLLDEELSEDELEDLKDKMCGHLKPRRLSDEEIEQLKKKDE